MNSRRAGFLAVALLVVLAGFFVVQAISGDDEPTPTTDEGLLPNPEPPGPVSGSIGTTAEELLDLLDGRRELTYHAIYEASGDPAVVGSAFTLEVWHDGADRVRQDTHISGDGGAEESATIVAGDEAVTCSRPAEGEWTCSALPSTPQTDVVAELADQLRGVDVVESDRDEIDGRAVRCFEFGAVDGPSEVCATPEGIPVLVDVGDTTFELTALDDTVPPTIFAPPAPVS